MCGETTKKTKDYVAIAERAITQILADGEKPTVAKVIAITGGSKRDFAPAFREAQERLREKEERRMAAPEMPADLVTAAHDLWVMSYEHASSDFQRLQVTTLEERDRWKESLLETEGLLATTEIEAEALEVRAKDAEAREVVLIKRVAKLELDLRVAHERLAERTEITRLLSIEKDHEQTTQAPQSQTA